MQAPNDFYDKRETNTLVAAGFWMVNGVIAETSPEGLQTAPVTNISIVRPMKIAEIGHDIV